MNDDDALLSPQKGRMDGWIEGIFVHHPPIAHVFPLLPFFIHFHHFWVVTHCARQCGGNSFGALICSKIFN
jgi:hypothetical protein